MKQEIEKLLKEVRACKHCEPQLPLGARPVFQLNPKAKILIAAQAPGWRVHETGLPFNDPSGDRLRDWLGVTRERFYDASHFAIIPMGLCFPGTGKFGDLPPRSECAPLWREKLCGCLPNLHLTLVIGTYACAYHLKDKKLTLTEAVRRWRDYLPAIFPLPHPSPRNNLWLKRNPWFDNEVIPALKERVSQILTP